jgi:hypothetical protein
MLEQKAAEVATSRKRQRLQTLDSKAKMAAAY